MLGKLIFFVVLCVLFWRPDWARSVIPSTLGLYSLANYEDFLPRYLRHLESFISNFHVIWIIYNLQRRGLFSGEKETTPGEVWRIFLFIVVMHLSSASGRLCVAVRLSVWVSSQSAWPAEGWDQAGPGSSSQHQHHQACLSYVVLSWTTIFNDF